LTVSRVQRRKDDENILRSLEVEEIKQDLQEMLVTLKQVGSEASEGIQEKVREAEAKTKRLRELMKKVDSDLTRISRLSEDVAGEKAHLDDKWNLMQATRQRPESVRPEDLYRRPEPSKPVADPEDSTGSAQPLSFPSDAVREIYRFADESMDISEIARRTKLTRGEVQLILNLRGNRYTTPN